MTNDSQEQIISNRLKKNLKKIRPWAKRAHFEAFRIYDRDIPEFPFILDCYKGHQLLYFRGDEKRERDLLHFDLAVSACKKIFFEEENSELIIKTRLKRKGKEQYIKIDRRDIYDEIREGDYQFLVNLYDYLDTGIFLDHRVLRQKLEKECLKREAKNVLNLFCYTASLSIPCAQAGAQVTSVDQSKKYLAWAEENFKINQIDPRKHHFIQADVLKYITEIKENQFDLILLDPPTYSNSKSRKDDFDVERDHSRLIHHLMKALTPDGILYFSNNKRNFKIDSEILESYHVKDVSHASIPNDFRDKKIHVLFEITSKS